MKVIHTALLFVCLLWVSSVLNAREKNDLNSVADPAVWMAPSPVSCSSEPSCDANHELRQCSKEEENALLSRRFPRSGPVYSSAPYVPNSCYLCVLPDIRARAVCPDGWNGFPEAASVTNGRWFPSGEGFYCFREECETRWEPQACQNQGSLPPEKMCPRGFTYSHPNPSLLATPDAPLGEWAQRIYYCLRAGRSLNPQGFNVCRQCNTRLLETDHQNHVYTCGRTAE